jgi:hypothetical protein
MDLIKPVLSVTAPEATENVMDDFAGVFTGRGLFPGECTIHLDPDATAVVYPPRKSISQPKRLEQGYQTPPLSLTDAR